MSTTRTRSSTGVSMRPTRLLAHAGCPGAPSSFGAVPAISSGRIVPSSRSRSPRAVWPYLGRTVEPMSASSIAARIGGLRGSPRQPATGRAACRRRQTPWARGGISGSCRRRRCRAGRARRRARSSRPSLTRRDEAHRQQHEVGLEGELGCPRSASASRRRARTSSPVTDAVLALERRCVVTANSRSAPSSWLDDVRSFSGQLGQVSSLSSRFGGIGMISSWVTLSAPWRIEVPMQSEPVSPPPITTTCLPPARIGSLVADRLAGPPGGSAAARIPSRSGRRELRPGTGKSREASAPPASTTASWLLENFLG